MSAEHAPPGATLSGVAAAADGNPSGDLREMVMPGISIGEGVVLVLAAAMATVVLAWVARDARRNGMWPVVWVVVVFSLNVLGLLAYFVARSGRINVAERTAK